MSKIKNLLSSKKANIIAGTVALAIAGGVLAVTVAHASFSGIISFFGQVTGQANVNQSIKLDDHVYGTNAAWTYTANNISAGETVFNGPHFIRNTASVPITVTLTTDPNPDNLNPSPVDRVWHNVQVTTGAKYTRNASFFKAQDGAYWLFFAQDTNPNQNGKGCDAISSPGCDSDTYEIYYSISLDKGVTWSAPIKMSQPITNFKQRDVSAFQDKNGKIWVFVSDGGGYGYIYYYTSVNNGASWNGPTTLWRSGSSANHAWAITKNNSIAVFYQNNGIKMVYSTDLGSNWNGPVSVASTAGAGVPKAVWGSDGNIRVVWTNVVSGNGVGIYMSTSNGWTNWTMTAGPIAEASGYFDYDPYLYQDTYGRYWLFWAPWDSAAKTQWIEYEQSADGLTWTQPKILMKRTGVWEMWPVVSQDDAGNMMVFYTSENNYNSGRVNGNIWLAKSGNWWNGNVDMLITIPASKWVGVDISNVFNDHTGASSYRTVTTVK